MIICQYCGVELENEMQFCPLCGEPVIEKGNIPVSAPNRQQVNYRTAMTKPQKMLTWEIISIILFSAIMATFIIDFIINKSITWSEYPVAISLVIFSYISLFAFWAQRIFIQMAGGFIISSLFLLILDIVTPDITWSFKLGMPLLLAGNVLTGVLIAVIRLSKYKGINLIAYVFLGAALLCICIDGIVSIIKTKVLHIEWSVIVAGCILPVVFVLFFVHFRLKKGRSLEKTFHI